MVVIYVVIAVGVAVLPASKLLNFLLKSCLMDPGLLRCTFSEFPVVTVLIEFLKE